MARMEQKEILDLRVIMNMPDLEEFRSLRAAFNIIALGTNAFDSGGYHPDTAY